MHRILCKQQGLQEYHLLETTDDKSFSLNGDEWDQFSSTNTMHIRNRSVLIYNDGSSYQLPSLAEADIFFAGNASF